MSTICDDLRAAILQAAMQGKLTKQPPEDGDAKDLLKQIETENGKLLANKRELPFEIPKNWQIVSLKDIALVIYGFPFNSQLFNKDGKGMPLVRIRDILPAESKTYTTEKAQDAYIVGEGDMLVGMDGNFNVNFWHSEDAYLNQRCCKITTGAHYNQRLLYWFLPYFLNDIFENVSYTTVKHLSDKHLTRMVVPLPPLAEQERIVEKIDELMARVADLEKSADALASLKFHYPDEMRASLLQAAMQGKLTKQLPEDGNAKDLIEEIKAEKEKLIAEGKIKKQKALAPISNNETPFSIPENWQWVRLPDISESLLGKTLNKSTDSGVEKPYLCSINIYWDGVDLNKVKTAKFSQSDIEQYKLSKKDLLVCEGGDVGRSAIWNLDSEMYYQNALHRIRFYGEINVEYMHKLLDCYKRIGLIDNYSKGVTIKHLVQSALNQIPIPLPPLAEQKRIVERLDALMQNINVVGDLIASE